MTFKNFSDFFGTRSGPNSSWTSDVFYFENFAAQFCVEYTIKNGCSEMALLITYREPVGTIPTTAIPAAYSVGYTVPEIYLAWKK